MFSEEDFSFYALSVLGSGAVTSKPRRVNEGVVLGFDTANFDLVVYDCASSSAISVFSLSIASCSFSSASALSLMVTSSC